MELRERIGRYVEEHALIHSGGQVTCLVSGGADSTCLFHVLRSLGYDVTALHVAHGLRGAESDEDARWCADRFDAEVVDGSGETTEAGLRRLRYSFRTDRLRATGHTLSDQVETILFRLATRGTVTGIAPCRDDAVVHPLLCVWRAETEEYCRAHELEWRSDSSNDSTARGLIRRELIPLLERLHPSAQENVLRVLDERRTLPPALAQLLDAPAGSLRVDLGDRIQAVREQDRLWLERTPATLDRPVTWGGFRIESAVPGLKVRGWRPGDRLAGRTKKIQDVFVDAKIPRSDREGWPLVVRGAQVVCVPGLVDAEGVTATRVDDRG